MTPATYPCQLCGESYSPDWLFDLKGSLPGGAKVTCLKCWGRLEEREVCAAHLDRCADAAEGHALITPIGLRHIAAAIRARGTP